MLVVVENGVDDDEVVVVKEEMERRDGIEMGKEKGRETVRDRSRKTELKTTPGATTETGTGTRAEVSADEQHVPQGIFKNQGSKISLYVQREVPGPDKRAHNVSRLFYRLYRNCTRYFFMCFK